jgi:hypothetical protein
MAYTKNNSAPSKPRWPRARSASPSATRRSSTARSRNCAKPFSTVERGLYEQAADTGLWPRAPAADPGHYVEGHSDALVQNISQRRKLFGGSPTYDGVGSGRRTLAWSVGNPGAVAALLFTQDELRAKSRDLVRRNAWANSALESYVANAIGTGIKPQSMVQDARYAKPSRHCGGTGARRRCRRSHRFLRTAGAGLSGHARRRRSAGAAALSPTRRWTAGGAAASSARSRASALVT